MRSCSSPPHSLPSWQLAHRFTRLPRSVPSLMAVTKSRKSSEWRLSLRQTVGQLHDG